MSAAGAGRGGPLSVAQRAGRQANFVSSPAGRRDAIQFTIKTDHTVWHDKPFTLRYTFGRDDRDLPFPARARNLPGFGISVLDQGHNFGRRLQPGDLRPRRQRAARRRQRAEARQPADQAPAPTRYAALGITGPSLPRSTTAIPTLVVSGYETLGDDPNLPVLRQHPHHSPRRHADARSRPSSPQDRRRVPRTTSPTATTTSSRVGRSRSPARSPAQPFARPAARLPDAVAARRQRQPQTLRTWSVNASSRTTGACRRG